MDSQIPEEKIVELANKQVTEISSRFLKFAEDIGAIRDWEQENERERILSLVDQAMQNHIAVEGIMFGEGSQAFSYDPFSVHERGLKVLEQLRECIGLKKTRFPSVDAPSPFTSEDEEPAEEEGVGVVSCVSGKCSCENKNTIQDSVDSCTPPIMATGEPLNAKDEMQLKKAIVRVMQLGGTKKDGNIAHWTLDQLSVGLEKLYPFLGDEVLTNAVGELSKESVIIPLSHGRFVLSDDCAAKPVVTPLSDAILEVLKSAKEEGGEYCGWTHNQLMFAVKRTSASLSDQQIKDEMAALVEKGRIVSFKGKTTNYVAIDEETMKLYKEKLIAIGHEPDPEAPAEEPAEKTVEKPAEPAPEPSKDNGDFRTWDDVKKALGLDELDDTTALVLMHMRQSPQRLWRNYDIEGLFGAHHDKPVMDQGNGEPGELRKSLIRLVQLGLVEHIPRDTRPSIRDDRWGLTELGRIMSR